MKRREEIAKRLDEALADWRKIQAEFRNAPFDGGDMKNIYASLMEVESEINTLRWVLDIR